MKSISLRNLPSIVVALGLAMMAAANAGDDANRIEKRLENYKNVADASTEQIAKIRTVLEKEASAKAAIPSAHLSATQIAEREKSITKETWKQINNILTPAQSAKMKAARKED